MGIGTLEPKKPDQAKHRRRLAATVAMLLAEQLRDALETPEFSFRQIPPRNTPEWLAYWRAQDKKWRKAILPILEAMANASLDELFELVKDLPEAPYIDPLILEGRQAVALWLDDYSFGLVKDINETSRQAIEDAIKQGHLIPGFTRQDMVDLLAPTFGPRRAEMIAVTETTRSYAEGQRLAAEAMKQAGIETVAVWHLNRARPEYEGDECDDRDGLPETEWPTDEFPPLHVNCECIVTFIVKIPVLA